MQPNEDLVVVFAGSIMEADAAKAALELNGIRAFLRDEAVGTWAPWYVAGGGVGAVKVVVPESEADKARAVLDHKASQDAEDGSAGG